MALIDGLISHWKLDETLNFTRNDSHGTNHLTASFNVTHSADGKIGNATDLESTTAANLTCASNSSLQIGGTSFTFAGWFKMESTGSESFMTLLCKDDVNASGREFLLLYTQSNNRFSVGVGRSGTTEMDGSYSSVVPQLNTWYFIVFWYDRDAQTVNIQINDGKIDSASKTTDSVSTNDTFRIGRLGNGQYSWDGLVDSVSFWKRALTAEERKTLYNAGRGLDYPFYPTSNTLNLAVATVSTGYSASAGTINLSSNHGLKFPSVSKPFYAVWWNTTDYSDPTDDPNREIVKVYRKMADKLFIQRGCLGTSPSTKNTNGKTYHLTQILDKDKLNKQLFYFKNPSRGYYYFHDFENAAYGVGVDAFLEKGGGSGQTRSHATAELNHPGIWYPTAGTSGSTVGIGLILGTASLIRLCQYDIESTWWFKIPSANNTNFRFIVGFTDSTSATGTLWQVGNNNICLYLNETFSHWRFLVEIDNSTVFLETLPVPFKLDTWYEVKMKITKEGVLEIYLNKCLIKRYVGDLPTAVDQLVTPTIAINNNGVAAGSNLMVDAFEFEAKFRNERTAGVLNS